MMNNKDEIQSVRASKYRGVFWNGKIEKWVVNSPDLIQESHAVFYKNEEESAARYYDSQIKDNPNLPLNFNPLTHKTGRLEDSKVMKLLSIFFMFVALFATNDDGSRNGMFVFFSMLSIIFAVAFNMTDKKISFLKRLQPMGIILNLPLFILFGTWFGIIHYLNVDQDIFFTYFTRSAYNPTLYTDALDAIVDRDLLFERIVSILILLQLILTPTHNTHRKFSF